MICTSLKWFIEEEKNTQKTLCFLLTYTLSLLNINSFPDTMEEYPTCTCSHYGGMETFYGLSVRGWRQKVGVSNSGELGSKVKKFIASESTLNNSAASQAKKLASSTSGRKEKSDI